MTVIATISRGALAHNLRYVKSLCAADCRALAMIKANAYGHGMLPTAKALAEADGFGVARLEEAMELRAALPLARIVVMSEIADTRCLNACVEHQLDLCLHSPDGLQQLMNATLAKPINVWAKLDTGMHRLGFQRGEVDLAVLKAHNNCKELIVCSHFASADCDAAATDKQLSQFKTRTHDSDTRQSLANSAAIIHYPETHFDWVRPGIMLYGANPQGESPLAQLKAAMRLNAPLLSVRSIGIGEKTGYGGSWTATRTSRIATIGIGYGDGYPRHAESGTPVFVANARCPLVGRVSMDMITVDVTDHPNTKDLNAGASVELWGPSNPVEHIANSSQTIAYALLTGISQRVKVVYEE